VTDYAALNAKVRSFKSRLTQLKNKGDHRGIVALWPEFEKWCNEHMWPDNWRLWESAKEDALWAMRNESGRW
jgi:hypothetical protein